MTTWIACLSLLAAQAAPAPGPYAGEERRAIKALSAADVAAYLEGHGMGYAKAAELNHYPGPKHVLELAEKLRLTAEQRARTEDVRRRMSAAAVALGRQVVEQEAALDRMFAAGTADEGAMEAVVKEAARLQGELRAVHLRAHVEMRRVLTADQVVLYDRLRGYAGPPGERAHPRHH
jgi:Spy/CpxP family protein refolding chaperone